MPTVTKQLNKPSPARGPVPNGRTVRSAWDLADSVRMLLYGASGTGKTTFWATFPAPILALVCSGGNRPGELRSVDTPENRERIDPVVVGSTAEFKSQLGDCSRYKTVVLDHATGFADLVLKEILGLDDVPVQKGWGLATQQQYGQLAMQCKEYFRSLLNLSCNVVIVAQERVFGEESASEVIKPTVGAALTPSLTGWLGPACDFVVQTYLRPRVEAVEQVVGGKRVVSQRRGRGVEFCLRTAPHETFQTKFRLPRGAELPECLVDPTYGKVAELMKGRGAVK